MTPPNAPNSVKFQFTMTNFACKHQFAGEEGELVVSFGTLKWHFDL